MQQGPSVSNIGASASRLTLNNSFFGFNVNLRGSGGAISLLGEKLVAENNIFMKNVA